MVISMTGHGQATVETDSISVSIEIRTVNNRFLKLALNSDIPAELQSNIEDVLRNRISRGTVNARLRIVPLAGVGAYRINPVVIDSYRQQLKQLGGTDSLAWEQLLMLPGVIDESDVAFDVEHTWPVVERALREALDHLEAMRRDEGGAMARNLLDNLEQLGNCVARVDELAPLIVEQYSTRLTARINSLLEKYDIRVQGSDVIREIGIFAERTDMAEETVRLKSHLALFRSTLEGETSNGRKLDFVVQEMLRETNTIGSKCSDAAVSAIVVEMKTIIERMREMVQNIE